MDTEKKQTGLSDEQVIESRKLHGCNLLTPPERDSLWKIFLENFKDPMIRILLMAVVLSAGISVILYFSEGKLELAETIGITVAILLATGVSTWFVNDANRKFDILNQVNDDTLVRVVRNGNVAELPKKDLVVGDIVMLEQGEEIPADGTLLEAISLQVNESTLTGEPVTDKTTDPARFDDTSTYPSNEVFRGTTVADGHGIMEVTAVGDATEFGKVARKATELSGEETPLNRQLGVLAKFIGVAGFFIAFLTFCILFIKGVFFNPHQPAPSLGQLGLLGAVLLAAFIGLASIWLPVVHDFKDLIRRKNTDAPRPAAARKQYWGLYGLITLSVLFAAGIPFGVKFWEPADWISLATAQTILHAFMAAVTLIVVAIPEGLPMSVTLSLAMSMRKMLKSNNLVRKMHACETMGAATVICTDKTGTLTKNQMSVYQTQFYGLKNQALADNELSELIEEGIAANTTAFLDLSEGEGKIKTLGNPTEAALLLWLHQAGRDYLQLRENTLVISQLTFSTERKYMATEVDSPLLKKKILYVKGAPEIVLGKCRTVRTETGLKPVTEEKAAIEAQLLAYQNQAMRTLGFAYKELDNGASCIADGTLTCNDLVFLGIVAISDPVREDVPAAVKACNDAGIKVKIVTGDTPGTAKEIGRQIGLWLPGDTERNHITGTEFAALTDEEALDRVQDLKIMSRARPTDKQRLVQLLQQKKEIVAVTGDGTNDAPALNYANVGLSMGSGTSVAKEASDITLLDDSFRSIAAAVMWGRSVYLNIQRFILFQLTINLVALVIVLLGSLLGTDSPITVTQMLWINLIMDTFAAGALASLPPSEDVMKQKPRNTADFIVTPAMRNRILGIGSVFIVVLLGMLYGLEQYKGGIDPATFTGIYNLTLFFTTFVMFQFWNLFNAKTFGNNHSAFTSLRNSKGFLLVAAAIVIGQFIVVTFGGNVFRTRPLSGHDWLLVMLFTSLILWSGEIIRAIRRARDKKRQPAKRLR
ncbi:MAG: calcium-translocating P-type ATPase, PMCA-type [Parabacteroides sp.]|nr:calcium-translocating P-type ATPase, PMCA-type [Parabacteroides sp.]